MATEPLSRLGACAGQWHGTNLLHDPNTNAPDTTDSLLTVIPVLGGKFVRFDYTWSYQGAPQEGELLIGFESEAGTFTSHWIDTWHMGDKVLVSSGTLTETGAVALLGSFAAPPGPDWGWRIELRFDAGHFIEVVMTVISPEGEASPAVEAHYTPA